MYDDIKVEYMPLLQPITVLTKEILILLYFYFLVVKSLTLAFSINFITDPP